MTCENWNSNTTFCHAKKITINFEDLNYCMQNCEFYTPVHKSKPLESRNLTICKECSTKFNTKNAVVIEVKNKIFVRCPQCGSVNIKREDNALK